MLKAILGIFLVLNVFVTYSPDDTALYSEYNTSYFIYGILWPLIYRSTQSDALLRATSDPKLHRLFGRAIVVAYIGSTLVYLFTLAFFSRDIKYRRPAWLTTLQPTLLILSANLIIPSTTTSFRANVIRHPLTQIIAFAYKVRDFSTLMHLSCWNYYNPLDFVLALSLGMLDLFASEVLFLDRVSYRYKRIERVVLNVVAFGLLWICASRRKINGEVSFQRHCFEVASLLILWWSRNHYSSPRIRSTTAAPSKKKL